MERDRINGTIILTPLTPVHIGNGNVLARLDYAIREGRYEVKDVQRFFHDHKNDIPYALEAVESGMNIGPEYVRYSLPYHGTPPAPNAQTGPKGGGTGAKSYKDPRSEAPFNPAFAGLLGGSTAPAPAPPKPAAAVKAPRHAAKPADPGVTVGDVREFIKDPFGRPFVPGSSVKGSLRTAIAWNLSKNQPLDGPLKEVLKKAADNARGGRPPRREGVDGPFMKPLFGDNPTVDLLKAFYVGDSAPLACDQGFAMCQVTVMNESREGFKLKEDIRIHVEALMPSAGAVKIPIRIDLFRLRKDTDLAKAAKGEGVRLLQDRDALTKAIAAYSRELLEYEAKFYDRRAPQLAQYIKGLLNTKTVVLPLGFGTGWHAKTIGRRLNEPDIRDLRKQFGGWTREGKPLKNMGTYGVDLFPKTRKWAKSPEGNRPMGWCKVEIMWE